MPPRPRPVPDAPDAAPVDPWETLLGFPGEPCGYTHPDHTHGDGTDGPPMVCVRAAGHPGDEKTPARDHHLARTPDGEPVFFGDPLVFDPDTGAPVSP